MQVFSLAVVLLQAKDKMTDQNEVEDETGF